MAAFISKLALGYFRHSSQMRARENPLLSLVEKIKCLAAKHLRRKTHLPVEVLMKLIFIYGLPAAGKLTVAAELAAMTGYKLFHNHLVVDLLLSVFDFGSPPFVELREDIWLSVFEQACRSQLPGLIFTFAPEGTVRPGFIGEVKSTVAREGGEIDFVELVCPLAELKRRMDSPSRLGIPEALLRLPI